MVILEVTGTEGLFILQVTVKKSFRVILEHLNMPATHLVIRQRRPGSPR